MKPSNNTTATEIARKIMSINQAINTRDFSPTSPAWTSMAPGFLAHPDGFGESHGMSLLEYLSWLKKMTMRSPGCLFEVLEINTYDRGSGCVDVYFMFEASGLCVGVRNRHLSVMEFERFGEWACLRLWGIRGRRGLDGL